MWRVEKTAEGRASRLLDTQMAAMATQRVLWEILDARGVMMALWRSRVMARRVNTEADTFRGWVLYISKISLL